MDTHKKQIGTFILILVIVGLMFTFLPKRDENGDMPPKLNINFSISTSKFSGATSIACMLPGIRYTEEDFLAYAPSVEFPEPEENNLRNGDHLYFADKDMTVSEIFANIVPKAGNKVLLAYYPNGRAALGDDFYLYPGVEGNKEITNPESFVIPGNHGFVLFSCLDSKILKVRSEDMDAFDLPEGLAVADNTWFLTSLADLTDLERYSDTLVAIYYQDAPGLTESFTELEEDGERDDYFSMVWLKLDSEEVAARRAAETPATTIDIDRIQVKSGIARPSVEILLNMEEDVRLEEYAVFYHFEGETSVHRLAGRGEFTDPSTPYFAIDGEVSKMMASNLTADTRYHFVIAKKEDTPRVGRDPFVPFRVRPGGAVNSIEITSATATDIRGAHRVYLETDNPEWASNELLREEYDIYFYLDGEETVSRIPFVDEVESGEMSYTLYDRGGYVWFMEDRAYNFIIADHTPLIDLEEFTNVVVDLE